MRLEVAIGQTFQHEDNVRIGFRSNFFSQNQGEEEEVKKKNHRMNYTAERKRKKKRNMKMGNIS